jgi:hypothetical protein
MPNTLDGISCNSDAIGYILTIKRLSIIDIITNNADEIVQRFVALETK